jgi:hypothetical protein
MKRWLACSLVGTFAGFALVSMSSAGCGGSSPGTQTDGGEGGSTMDHVIGQDHAVGKDVEKKDSIEPFDGSGDAGDGAIPEEGGPPPPAGGTQLLNTVSSGLSNGSIAILGLTDDNDYVIYEGSTATSVGVYEVPIAGGAPTTIVSYTASDASTSVSSINTVLAHSTVFVWTNATQDSTSGNEIGTLALIWTKATASSPFKPNVASAVGLVDADPTNTNVVYTTTNTTGTLGTFVAATLGGTPTPTTLLSNTATNYTDSTGYFEPQVQFLNSTTLAIAHEEMGASSATVSTFATSGWAKTDLLTGPLVAGGKNPLTSTMVSVGSMFSAATGGTSAGNPLAVATAAGDLQTFPNGSATGTTIASGVTNYAMNPDGTSIFFSVSGTLQEQPLPTGAGVTIQATGFAGFIDGCTAGVPCSPISESPNDLYTVFSEDLGASLGENSIWLTSNTMGATANGILTANSGAVFGDAFTADSSNVLYVSNFQTVDSTDEVGYLWAYPVSGSVTSPGNSITKNNLWEYNYIGSHTTILYSDNFMASSATAGPSGYADIKTVDVAKLPVAPTTVMESTDVNPSGYYVTTDRKTVVWVMSVGNVKTDGIWAFAPTAP